MISGPAQTLHFRTSAYETVFRLPLCTLMGCCRGPSATAQKSAPSGLVAQKNVTVTVVDAHLDPPQPVSAIRVSLVYLDGSRPHHRLPQRNQSEGRAYLMVSADIAQRDDLRLEVQGNPKLVIFEPADGQLHGLASRRWSGDEREHRQLLLGDRG
jgi:hypothetical protein